MHELIKSDNLFINKISRCLGNIGVILMIPAMTILTTVDVALRYVFNAPIHGAHDYTGLIMMVLVLSSLSYCWIERGHVRMEILVRHFSRRKKLLSVALSAGAGCCLWGMVSYYSFIYLFRAIEFREISMEAGILLWPFRFFFTIGVTVFTLQMFWDLVKHLKKAVQK